MQWAKEPLQHSKCRIKRQKPSGRQVPLWLIPTTLAHSECCVFGCSWGWSWDSKRSPPFCIRSKNFIKICTLYHSTFFWDSVSRKSLPWRTKKVLSSHNKNHVTHDCFPFCPFLSGISQSTKKITFTCDYNIYVHCNYLKKRKKHKDENKNHFMPSAVVNILVNFIPIFFSQFFVNMAEIIW